MTRYRQYRTPIFLTGAATLCVLFGAGCTDLKPTQVQLDDLQSQVRTRELPRGTRDGSNLDDPRVTVCNSFRIDVNKLVTA